MTECTCCPDPDEHRQLAVLKEQLKTKDRVIKAMAIAPCDHCSKPEAHG